MNSQRKIFMIELHSLEGKVISRTNQEIEDNPEYGKVELEKIMISNPNVNSASILEQQFTDAGTPKFMTDEKGATLKDGDGNPRLMWVERMRYSRCFTSKAPGQEFAMEFMQWPVMLH